jgi:hypothetical protein
MEQEIVPHDGNSQQSFTMLPLKPNGPTKNTGAHDRNQSDPTISSQQKSHLIFELLLTSV